MLQHVVVNINITISSCNYSTKKYSACTALSVSELEETTSTPTSRNVENIVANKALCCNQECFVSFRMVLSNGWVSGARKCHLMKCVMFAPRCFVHNVCAEYEAVQWQCIATCMMIVKHKSKHKFGSVQSQWTKKGVFLTQTWAQHNRVWEG